MRSDIEIAHSARKRPIEEIAAKIGLRSDDLIPYGRYIAKVPPTAALASATHAPGRLVLVTAMTPTRWGEGKTTTTIGLGQALERLGKKAIAAIREPSLGPCMGVKGGAAGGGFSQVLPMEDINLHFTGDMHAVSAAHNLLAALLDNHLHHRNEPSVSPRTVCWRRAIDMNDRSLRSIIVGIGGEGSNGVMREDGFVITPASEVMAILCLASDLDDLKRRIGRIIVGYGFDRKPVTASALGAQGAMAALLNHAVNPNLVQSVEGTPVFVHGGPFANIAHGCNSLVATRTALSLGEYVVTEAGFGADLGAEKFFDIKCRIADLKPSAAVLVVTRRAVAVHGMENVVKHVENVRRFGVPVVVSINRFPDDEPAQLEEICSRCADAGIDGVVSNLREQGGAGGTALAEKVVTLCEGEAAFAPLYPLELSPAEKVRVIAREIYGAGEVEFSPRARAALDRLAGQGYGNLPICMAKTPSSLSDDPRKTGRPRDFVLGVSDVAVSAGAGFIVAATGSIMTMPGLPARPSAQDIDVDSSGTILGLF